MTPAILLLIALVAAEPRECVRAPFYAPELGYGVADLCAETAEDAVDILPEGTIPYNAEPLTPAPEADVALWWQGEPPPIETAACAPVDPAEPVCEMLVAEAEGVESWQPAPPDLTIPAGRWRGACIPKVAVELAGISSMPDACRVAPPAPPPEEP